MPKIKLEMKFVWRTISLLLLSMAISVGSFASASAGPCDGTPESAKITVLGDWLPWAVQGPIVAAQKYGYYTNEGIEVELIAPAAVTDQLKFVSTGRVQFSIVESPLILTARDEGFPVVSVAALHQTLTIGLMVRGDSGISTAADLKGKTLGVNPLPSALAWMRTLLSSAGLTEDDVKVIDPGYSAMFMLIEEKIDASHSMINADPYIVNPLLAEQGKPPVGFLLYKDFGVPNFPLLVMAANEDWIKANPAATCRFFRATKRGLDEFLKNPEPINKDMAALNEIYTLDQHRALTEGAVPEWVNEDGEVFVQSEEIWRQMVDWASEHGLVEKPQPAANYFTNDYLP